MDYTHLPHTISSKNPSMRGSHWTQDSDDLDIYWFITDYGKTGIIAFFLRQNNRGITLQSFNFTGDPLEFTLKPNAWDFEYSSPTG